jgi:hypothetical protein
MWSRLTSLTASELNTIDLRPYITFTQGTTLSKDGNLNDLYKNAGEEHYKLLYWLSHQIHNSIIFDIGTHLGSSAALLAANKTNKVLSFDIVKKGHLPKVSNVMYCVQDLTNPLERNGWEEILLQSPLIFLDIDPHEGKREYTFYQWLKEKEYKGLLVCDDIVRFADMRTNFWDKIPDVEKYDCTHLGHVSGTGIINISQV